MPQMFHCSKKKAPPQKHERLPADIEAYPVSLPVCWAAVAVCLPHAACFLNTHQALPHCSQPRHWTQTMCMPGGACFASFGHAGVGGVYGLEY